MLTFVVIQCYLLKCSYFFACIVELEIVILQLHIVITF